MSLLRLRSPAAAADWLASRVHGSLRADSRALQAGDGFLAWPGVSSDGRRFVRMALDAGAAACLVDDSDVQDFGFDDGRIATLPNLKAEAGAVADAVYGQPSADLDVLAVTGTNGKTSTAWWLAQALTLLGRRCGLMGTLGVGEPPLQGQEGLGTLQSTGLTTPDALTLHTALRRFADDGLQACALEASSIGLVDHRLAAVRITVALFTNLTRDHLDVHGDMASYWAAKRSLFRWPGLRAAVVNVDAAHGAALAAELQHSGLDLWTVSCETGNERGNSGARLQARGLRHTADGMAFELLEAGAAGIPVTTPLVGGYNASNLLVVAAGLRALGLPLADVAAVLCRLQPVPGRLQRVATEMPADVEVLVDYAHTPDALDKVLQALRPLATARGGQLVCVFGCGGNRDASKRPLMGRIAEQRADRVLLTSDNPRHEAPAAILGQILAGLEQPAAARVIEDRQAAIVHAITRAHAGDVVLLAGKGHEQEQEMAGVKRPFSDIAEAQAALRLRSDLRLNSHLDAHLNSHPQFGGSTGATA